MRTMISSVSCCVFYISPFHTTKISPQDKDVFILADTHILEEYFARLCAYSINSRIGRIPAYTFYISVY